MVAEKRKREAEAEAERKRLEEIETKRRLAEIREKALLEAAQRAEEEIASIPNTASSMTSSRRRERISGVTKLEKK